MHEKQNVTTTKKGSQKQLTKAMQKTISQGPGLQVEDVGHHQGDHTCKGTTKQG